jgi:hypothetical protein
MAKIAALIAALAAIPEHKALVEAAKAELGALADLDAKDLATEFSQAKTQIADLAKSVKDLDVKAKGAEALQAIVAGYESRDTAALIATEFGKVAKAHGVRETAVQSAVKLADLSAVKVDLAKRSVVGITKDLFESLKKDHPVLFEDAKVDGATPPAAITPLAPAGNNGAAQTKLPDLPGPMGGFIKAAQM